MTATLASLAERSAAALAVLGATLPAPAPAPERVFAVNLAEAHELYRRCSQERSFVLKTLCPKCGQWRLTLTRFTLGQHGEMFTVACHGQTSGTCRFEERIA